MRWLLTVLAVVSAGLAWALESRWKLRTKVAQLEWDVCYLMGDVAVCEPDEGAEPDEPDDDEDYDYDDE